MGNSMNAQKPVIGIGTRFESWASDWEVTAIHRNTVTCVNTDGQSVKLTHKEIEKQVDKHHG